mmetsp:Transcript_19302/g.54895  ORF Transcript_19302/g.54895 Transcript_19302/m.54895 type:complete len:1149 (+) Transcript_19302:167-3613(+)
MAAELPTLFSEVSSSERQLAVESSKQLGMLLERASADVGRLIGEALRSSGRVGSICEALGSEIYARDREVPQIQRLLFILSKLVCDDVDSVAWATRRELRGRKVETMLVECVTNHHAVRTRYLAASALQELCEDPVIATAAIDAGAVIALQRTVRHSAAGAASARRGEDAELLYRYSAGALNVLLRARRKRTSIGDRPGMRTTTTPASTLRAMSALDHQHTYRLDWDRIESPSSVLEVSLPSIDASPRPSMPPSRASSRPMSGSVSLPSLAIPGYLKAIAPCANIELSQQGDTLSIEDDKFGSTDRLSRLGPDPSVGPHTNPPTIPKPDLHIGLNVDVLVGPNLNLAVSSHSDPPASPLPPNESTSAPRPLEGVPNSPAPASTVAASQDMSPLERPSSSAAPEMTVPAVLIHSPSRSWSASRQPRKSAKHNELSYDDLLELLELAVTAGDESLIVEALATASRAGVDLDQLEADFEEKQSYVFSPRPPTPPAERRRRAAEKAAIEAERRKQARIQELVAEKSSVDKADTAAAAATAEAAEALRRTKIRPGAPFPPDTAFDHADEMAKAAASAKAQAASVRRGAYGKAALVLQASVRKMLATRFLHAVREAHANDRAQQEQVVRQVASDVCESVVSNVLFRLRGEASQIAAALAGALTEDIISRALGKSFLSAADAARAAGPHVPIASLPSLAEIKTVTKAKEVANALHAQSKAQAAEISALQAALESIRGRRRFSSPTGRAPEGMSYSAGDSNPNTTSTPSIGGAGYEDLTEAQYLYAAMCARISEHRAQEKSARLLKNNDDIQERLNKARQKLRKLKQDTAEEAKAMREWEKQMESYCFSTSSAQERERIQELREERRRLEELIHSEAAERAKRLVRRQAERASYTAEAAAKRAEKYRSELEALNRQTGDLHEQRLAGIDHRRQEALDFAASQLRAKLAEQEQIQSRMRSIRRMRLPPLQVPTADEKLREALGKGLDLETYAGGLPPDEVAVRRPELAKAIRQLSRSPNAGRGPHMMRRRIYGAPPQPSVYRDAVLRSSRSLGSLPAIKTRERALAKVHRSPEPRKPPARPAWHLGTREQVGKIELKQGRMDKNELPVFVTEPDGVDTIVGCDTMTIPSPSGSSIISERSLIDDPTALPRHRRRDSL